MKKYNTCDIINETLTFGKCYLGNEEILGWKRIDKLIRKVYKDSREMNYDNIYFTHNNCEWYAVKG